MEKAIKQILAVSGLLLVSGCAVMEVHDYPKVEVGLSDQNAADPAKEVIVSLVDFFQENSKNVSNVCNQSAGTTARLDRQGMARIEARSRKKVLNFLNLDGALETMSEDGRGFAICMRRASGTIEYLTTIKSNETFLAAGTTITVMCSGGVPEWQCASSIKG